MRQSEYIDNVGRKFLVALPDDSVDVEHGMIIGPPFLDDLGLPDDVMIRLHNELYVRKLFTKRDLVDRRQDVIGALQHALRVDILRIMELYDG